MASVQTQRTDARATIGEVLEQKYLSSRPLQTIFEEKGLQRMTPSEKATYANYLILESRSYLSWPSTQQKEFLKLVDQQKIPQPLPKPKPEDLGYEGFERPASARGKGRRLWDMTADEYREWGEKERELEELRRKSWLFREKVKELKQQSEGKTVSSEEVSEEKQRRKTIALLEGKQSPGRYAGDPAWDDIEPIPQDDGEKPLSAIAYTPEYAEASSYLRAVMATYEHSPRVLPLTAHIIDLNPAHYTVWLYRASTIFALHADKPTLLTAIKEELEWVNVVALENQKNYQIWHHRFLLVEALYPTFESQEEKDAFSLAEIEFMNLMFENDSKNYHVWSYRQYFVRKLDLFNDDELARMETMLEDDVRNNSAWSHRFFVVFSNPKYTTEGSRATQADPKIPADIIEREIEFTKGATYLAPQNQSPWNYLRGVLAKGGRKLADLEIFAAGFVKLGEAEGGEEIKSSHALEFLADVWAEKNEPVRAAKAYDLLSTRYDAVRKNYWDWRKSSLKGTDNQSLPIR